MKNYKNFFPILMYIFKKHRTFCPMKESFCLFLALPGCLLQNVTKIVLTRNHLFIYSFIYLTFTAWDCTIHNGLPEKKKVNIRTKKGWISTDHYKKSKEHTHISISSFTINHRLVHLKPMNPILINSKSWEPSNP